MKIDWVTVTYAGMILLALGLGYWLHAWVLPWLRR